jgi:WD40 repeat protein
VVTASSDKTARIWDARTGQPIGAALLHPDAVLAAAFSADDTRVVTVSSNTARIWDAPTGTASDAQLLAEAGEALSGFTLNANGSLVDIESGDARVRALRAKAEHLVLGKLTATSVVHWLFEDPWGRPVSPQSTITVNDYIIERLKRCTDAARLEAQSYFPGHPLLLGKNEFCSATVVHDADGTLQRRK